MAKPCPKTISYAHLPDLVVVNRPLNSLRPNERNARTHSPKQIHQVAASIAEFGFVNPVLITADGGIVAGHCRVAAARQLGFSQVPTIDIGHLTPEQTRAYMIADNKLAEQAGWDPAILKLEFEELQVVSLSFDLEITGFATAEIDRLTEFAIAADTDPSDSLPDAGPPVTALGDLWLLGPHRLLCGDALKAVSYTTLLGDERVRLVFADPPYNVPIDGHVGGMGAIKHREFAMASGEMSREQFVAFLTTVFRNLAAVSLDGAIHYQCMDWRHMAEMLEAGRQTYSELKNVCTWVKDNGGMGSFYRSRHEFIFVWKVGEEAHVNTIELGRHGRYRTNVWEYAGVNTLKKTRMEELAMHPTVKPYALVQDAIKDASRQGDLVLDPFGGSGTTLIAAEKTRRKARLIELDPLYCDVIVRRWQKLTRQSAVHATRGQSFDDLSTTNATEETSDA